MEILALCYSAPKYVNSTFEHLHETGTELSLSLHKWLYLNLKQNPWAAFMHRPDSWWNQTVQGHKADN